MLARPEAGGLLVNVGCGSTPTDGWLNFDNSPTVALAAHPWLWPLLPKMQRDFARAARIGGVRRADATRLPLKTASVRALYSSHMMEHLDRQEAKAFLAEAFRVVKPGGVLRLSMPDLRKIALDYLEHGDADRFVEDTIMGTERARTFPAWVRHVVAGPRHHLWMYDGESLKRLVEAAGFEAARVVTDAATTIPEPGALNLRERLEQSVVVEARRP